MFKIKNAAAGFVLSIVMAVTGCAATAPAGEPAQSDLQEEAGQKSTVQETAGQESAVQEAAAEQSEAQEDVFDVIEETNDEEERYEKLEKVWEKLKEVDRMILVGYYVDGNNMEEIAKKVGYKNGDSVKSRKKKLLDKLKKEKRE